MERYEFNRQLVDTARAMAAEIDVDQTLDRVVALATDLLPHCDLAGLAVLRPGGIEILAANRDELRLIDELQHEFGEGPCLGAVSETDVVSVGNVEADPRWPRWGPYVSEHFDIRSAISFHLFTEGQTSAALNVYAKKPDAFTQEDLVDGLVVAAQAAVALAAVLELDQLHQALRNRQTIGEAMGMLRERFDLTSDKAFAVLKRLSSYQNVKLVHVAQHIVDTGSLPGAPDSPDTETANGRPAQT